MKKASLILVILTVSLTVVAQKQNKQNEVGIIFRSLKNFGLTYKTGKINSFWCFKTLIISGSSQDAAADSIKSSENRLGFNIETGLEYRKAIVENLEFRYGANISFEYSQEERERNDQSVLNYNYYNKYITYQPGINLVIGLNYIIKEKFVIGAELSPYFKYISGIAENKDYYYDYEEESDISGFSFGLSNSSVLLSVVYRF